MTLKEGARQ